jgi:hypothetical protein
MPRAALRFEEAGGQRLPLGGRNCYLGVRGTQGRAANMFQGMAPKKQHRTRLCQSAQEAAIALAQMKEPLELGIFEERRKKGAADCQRQHLQEGRRRRLPRPPAAAAASRYPMRVGSAADGAAGGCRGGASCGGCVR